MNEPKQFIAGDTVKWSETFTGYSSDGGFALKYEFRGENKFTVVGVANGSGFDFTISADDSEKITPGFYSYQIFATKTSPAERYTIGSGSVEVIVNLAKQIGNYESRSHAVRTLELIEASIERLSTNATQSATVAGKTFTKFNLPDLIILRDKYRADVYREKQAENIRQGRHPRKILARLI